MGCKYGVVLPALGKQNAALSLKFTQPGKVILVQPCIGCNKVRAAQCNGEASQSFDCFGNQRGFFSPLRTDAKFVLRCRRPSEMQGQTLQMTSEVGGASRTYAQRWRSRSWQIGSTISAFQSFGPSKEIE